jgi:hypothetical protein
MPWWKLSGVCSLLPVVNKVQGSKLKAQKARAFVLCVRKGRFSWMSLDLWAFLAVLA